MKKTHQILILTAIYLLALGIRIYWLTQKDGFHVDEGLTVAYSCCNNFIVRENYKEGKKYTGKELKEASLVNNTGLKSTLGDVRNLWKDSRDAPHTNLYYTILRLSFIGAKPGEISSIIVRGSILNLLLFTVSFIFFFILMRLLFAGSELMQYTAVLCAFLSTAAISNTLFFRPYQLQETMFIIFCYYFVLSLDWKKYFIHEKKIFLGVIKPLLFMSLITALTLLTGYFAFIFIGLSGLYAIYYQCKNKTFSQIPFYFAVLGLGILFAQVLFLKYLSGFLSYRGVETFKTISNKALENIKSSLISAGTLFQKHFFTYPVIVIFVLCAAVLIIYQLRGQKLKKNTLFTLTAVQKTAFFIFAASIIYLLAVLITAPYKILRYGMPVFPFFVILPVMLIGFVKEKSQKIAAFVMVLLCACFVFYSTREDKIENIFRGKPDQYIFTKNKEIPVYVINGSWSAWKYGNFTPYVNDEQAYYFVDWFKSFEGYLRSGEEIKSIVLPEIENYVEIYLVTEYNPWFSQLDSLLLENLKTTRGVAVKFTEESNFEIFTGEPETWYPYFIGRKLRLDNR
jgi:hypothetical protein